jgi:hypothetical protein
MDWELWIENSENIIILVLSAMFVQQNNRCHVVFLNSTQSPLSKLKKF